MPLLSELTYAAFLCYTSKGDDHLAILSRERKNVLKNDRMHPTLNIPMSRYTSQRIAELKEDPAFKGLFEEDTFLVPVPKHSVTDDNTFWVGKRLAEAMEQHKLGSCRALVKRIKKVNKSSSGPANKRPTPQEHYESMMCTSTLQNPSKIVLIEDVIVSGATALGAASRLKDTYPNAEIYVFAFIRYENNREKLTNLVDPTRGRITLQESGLAQRVP